MLQSYNSSYFFLIRNVLDTFLLSVYFLLFRWLDIRFRGCRHVEVDACAGYSSCRPHPPRPRTPACASFPPVDGFDVVFLQNDFLLHNAVDGIVDRFDAS